MSVLTLSLKNNEISRPDFPNDGGITVIGDQSRLLGLYVLLMVSFVFVSILCMDFFVDDVR